MIAEPTKVGATGHRLDSFGSANVEVVGLEIAGSVVSSLSDIFLGRGERPTSADIVVVSD